VFESCVTLCWPTNPAEAREDKAALRKELQTSVDRFIGARKSDKYAAAANESFGFSNTVEA
jgi:hypothetical protein